MFFAMFPCEHSSPYVTPPTTTTIGLGGVTMLQDKTKTKAIEI
jgi:hypothetical protein